MSLHESSRLDRIYLPNRWKERVVSYGIILGTGQSDHASAVLTVNTKDLVESKKKKGGTWRLNLSLLSEEGVREQVEGL